MGLISKTHDVGHAGRQVISRSKESKADSPSSDATSGATDDDEQHGFKDKLKHPFSGIREKLKDTHLYDIKVKAVHMKHEIGKLENLINPNHRHDEKHEKETDEKRSNIAESHRFQSFAPEREGNKIKWYIDGRDYFWALSVALERAKETIYIMDWWLSPELFLRRPAYYNQEWRLDQILKRAAERGVKVYVQVYKEVSQALTCNSFHTKKALHALCPPGSKGHGNITVMRHPDHISPDYTLYWAHHEKNVTIDYNLSFIGGLDLCFGRWDTRHHPLADVHPLGARNEIWPGQDFNNNRIMDFQTVEDWKSNELAKTEYGRMPWHDVAMGVIGPCVYDIAEHFVLRWNFTKRDKYKRDERYDWLTMHDRTGGEESLIGVQRPKHPVGDYVHHPLSHMMHKSGRPEPDNKQGSVQAQLVRSSADWSSGILTEHSIQTAYIDVIKNAEHFVYIENQFFITATGQEQKPIQNQIGRAIADACIRAAKEQRKFRVIVVIPAIPGFAGDLRDDAAAGTRAIMDYQYKSIHRGEHSIMGQIKAAGVDPHKYLFFFNLRSYDRLNATAALKRQEEQSGVKYQDVQRAEAEEVMSSGVHGIDGEDASSSSDDGDEEDEGEKQKRIDKKRRFEAKQEQAKHHTDEQESVDSIAKSAMLNEPKVSEEKWQDKQKEEEKDNFVQEELYIHGKVCIVDDKIALCGSSNINDRSQVGFHDSELTIVMQDTEPLESRMDGKQYTASHLAATLRRMLWREHLGLLPAQSLDGSDDPNAQPPNDSPNFWHEGDEYDELVADPLGDKVWDLWTKQADTNTQVFRDLFHADPDDSIRNFDDYEKFLPKESGKKQGHLFDPSQPVDEIRKQLDKIRGHLVWFPLRFLEDASQMSERGLAVNVYTESIYT